MTGAGGEVGGLPEPRPDATPAAIALVPPRTTALGAARLWIVCQVSGVTYVDGTSSNGRSLCTGPCGAGECVGEVETGG